MHRSDGSGTTYIFTDFLSDVSKEWKDKVGTGKSVQWPGANTIGGKGNEGVAGQVRQTSGAIGYVELAYAIENKMTTAQLENKSGKWLYCTASTVRASSLRIQRSSSFVGADRLAIAGSKPSIDA